jgi:hypothetical protein
MGQPQDYQGEDPQETIHRNKFGVTSTIIPKVVRLLEYITCSSLPRFGFKAPLDAFASQPTSRSHTIRFACIVSDTNKTWICCSISVNTRILEYLVVPLQE